MRETCLEKHLWNKLCIKYAGSTFKIPFCMGWQSYKENPECGPPGSFTSRHSPDLTVKAEWSCSLSASFLLFHQLCGDKRIKMFFSLPEISDSGKSLIILENQEGEKNKASEVFFVLFFSCEQLHRLKSSLMPFLYWSGGLWRHSGSPGKRNEGRMRGVLQYNRKRSTMLVDRLKELNFKGFLIT